MKVLLVSSSSGSRGGGELYLKNLAAGLNTAGVACQLMLSSHAQMDELAHDCEAAGIDVTRFAYRNTYHRRLRSVGAALDSAQIRHSAEVMEQWNPDIIHLNLQNVEDGLDLLKAASRTGIPSVSTVHQPSSMAGLKALAGRLRDVVAKRAFRRTEISTIAVSHASAKVLADFLGRKIGSCDGMPETKTGQVFHVSNGVPEPVLQDRERVRSKWNIGPDNVVLGCVGRIEPEKNPGFVCQLMQKLPKNVHCVWIGDGRLRPDVERQISQLDLQSRFHLMGWQTEAASYLSGFDVFLLPSLYEGLPLALLEAMSARLPSIASDIDGTRDAFDHDKHGFFSPVGDHDAWRQTITRLIAAESLRRRIGTAARERYEAEFSVTAMTRRTVSVYECLLAAQQARNE